MQEKAEKSRQKQENFPASCQALAHQHGGFFIFAAKSRLKPIINWLVRRRSRTPAASMILFYNPKQQKAAKSNKLPQTPPRFPIISLGASW